MPRKTSSETVLAGQFDSASMRPRPDAAENADTDAITSRSPRWLQ